jgi:hypothetical protein
VSHTPVSTVKTIAPQALGEGFRVIGETSAAAAGLATPRELEAARGRPSGRWRAAGRQIQPLPGSAWHRFEASLVGWGLRLLRPGVPSPPCARRYRNDAGILVDPPGLTQVHTCKPSHRSSPAQATGR